MYRMILADDEPQILEGVRGILDWEKYKIKICGTAENGERALELVYREQPQILITDIRMPGMDGLELTRRIHKEDLPCKVVVLSGYDDFDYVRTAMKHGAVDYLKKPLGRQDILRVIEEILDTLEDEVLSRVGNEEDLKLSKIYFVNRLIQNSISPMEIREKQDFFSANFLRGTMYIGILSYPFTDSEAFFAYRSCEETLGSHSRDLLFRDNFGNLCLLFFAETPEELMQAKEVMRECRDGIAKALGRQARIALGQAAASWRELRASYQSALKALDGEEKREEKPLPSSKMVQFVLEKTKENYGDAGLSLQTLAETMQMNPAYLGRTFKKETGKSYADYLNELRVEKAKELLLTTNRKGSQVSESVGFTSYNYFYIVFKRLTGMKPTDVRFQK